ncbi:hypothetical protein GA0074695_6397 [Micromonospora viridifaciens]|uniref:Uncharacterized protein n=1 Tax=Micromonospora viridifaciens TaxID=1881 RepID=A0A1C5A075_MICVI|nr:hypothetical protein [Micromonospora viridifaciens]SCF38501.1 hypothetical protein GA0074695_6397 [Micromonospora viridifaciens]
MPSWEEMCQQIVIDGRPGDVNSAAAGWEVLLKNLTTVKQNLETNVKDLNETWKGPAYEAFKSHVEGLAKRIGGVVDDAQAHGGIAPSLRDAAERLHSAQAAFPIPLSCVNDVLEARNAELTIGVGFFEAKVKPDFMGLVDPITSMMDWFNDKTDDAAKVYNQVSGEYLDIESRVPDSTGRPEMNETDPWEKPKLDDGGGGGGGGGTPDIGGSPDIGGLGDRPSMGGDNKPPSIGSTGLGPGSGGSGIGSGTHPDLSSGAGGYHPGAGTGSLASEYGSGLAGAGSGLDTPSRTGLGGGGGGLPGTTGLGGAGGGPGTGGGLGAGGGMAGAGGGFLGGGALGRPVGTGVPMMGGGMAGGGRGGAGRPGAGGMAGAGGRGAAGGAHGANASQDTWLHEDEDVWGSDSGGSPGILR